MHRRIRQAFTSLREHSRVSYAKIATIGGLCDIDLTIVKAASPDDFPLADRYVHDFLNIFSITASSNRTFAISFSRRLAKTRSWRVALKCLILLHRLLRTLPDDSRLRSELLWARTQRLLSLYPCNFTDSSSSASKYYTAFVRSYARLLDEAITCVSPEMFQQSIEQRLTYKIEDMRRIIETLPQLQSLTDRCIDCLPTGAASTSFLVHSAMNLIIRDSFMCYATFESHISIILDNLIHLPYRSSLAAFGIYKKASSQAEKLSDFHDFCKSMGYCGFNEYPFIERIPEIQTQALETFLNGMWSFTDQSSNVSTLTSNVQSPLSFTDDSSEKEMKRQTSSGQEKDIELQPLIKWEDEISTDYGNWEDLLDASISTNPCMDSKNNWQMEVYNPYVIQTPNPFYQPHRIDFFHG
ncbi:Epsin N-terminal domain-containing protein [Dorcoceras hygrometricum]|uniref:Epsin N-terminal domain-containing protein n=1 Tax=Dorcoceras hygrometricum TaxID=472368 RepID=A0A2Z7CNN9_9LAMI|nr:Epsin N-terminal domain-containing protein [Dorcoceras hygrometricum]